MEKYIKGTSSFLFAGQEFLEENTLVVELQGKNTLFYIRDRFSIFYVASPNLSCKFVFHSQFQLPSEPPVILMLRLKFEKCGKMVVLASMPG